MRYLVFFLFYITMFSLISCTEGEKQDQNPTDLVAYAVEDQPDQDHIKLSRPHPQLQQFKSEVLRLLEPSKRTVNERLDLSIPPVVITLCPSKEEMLNAVSIEYGAAPRSWSAGLALPRHKAIFLPITPSTELAPLLRHELTHIALGTATIPLWINEGISVTVGEGLSFDRIWALNEAANTGNLLSFVHLIHRFPEHGKPAQIAYAQSAHFIHYLRQTQGEARFKAWLSELLKGREANQAAQLHFTSSLWDLERKWRDTLQRGPFAWLSWLAQPDALWPIALLIFLFFGGKRIKKRNRGPQRREIIPQIVTARSKED